MQGTTPGAGYLPALTGGVLIVLSAVNLVRSLTGAEVLKAGLTRVDVLKFVGIIVAMLAFVLITPRLGMTLAETAMVAMTAPLIRPSHRRPYLCRVAVASAARRDQE